MAFTGPEKLKDISDLQLLHRVTSRYKRVLLIRRCEAALALSIQCNTFKIMEKVAKFLLFQNILVKRLQERPHTVHNHFFDSQLFLTQRSSFHVSFYRFFFFFFQCDNECGAGKQKRDVMCMNTLRNRTAVSCAQCLKPLMEKDCNTAASCPSKSTSGLLVVVCVCVCVCTCTCVCVFVWFCLLKITSSIGSQFQP